MTLEEAAAAYRIAFTVRDEALARLDAVECERDIALRAEADASDALMAALEQLEQAAVEAARLTMTKEA